MFARSLILCALLAAGTALADTKTLCPDAVPHSNAREEALLAQAEKLQEEGYVFQGFIEKQIKQSYVGIGLRLRPYVFGFGTVTDGTVPNSPAERSEFFGEEYFVLAVDGVPLEEAPMTDIAVVRRAIMGSGKKNTGVVLTLERTEDGRQFVRYFERKQITINGTVMCVRYRK